MDAVLLDTDVFSFVFKRDTRASLYARHISGVQPCPSFQTIAELRLWSFLRRWGERRRQGLDASLARCVVLPYGDATTRIWAEITAHRHGGGKLIACGDAWIAAGAVRHGLTLLTHNAADYAEIQALKLVCYS
jgi:predicted nucleic acid-binding protein